MTYIDELQDRGFAPLGLLSLSAVEELVSTWRVFNFLKREYLSDISKVEARNGVPGNGEHWP